MILPAILWLALVAQTGEVETCQVANIDSKDSDRQVTLVCRVDKTTGDIIGYLLRLPSWPKEWTGADHEGATVKMQAVENSWIPIAPCKVRIAAAEKEARRKRVGERALPNNFYIPKDCQGEKEN